MRTNVRVLWTLPVALMFAGVAAAMGGRAPSRPPLEANVSRLVSDLTGGNDAARVTARQLLPRLGVDAVAPLVPVMGHENPGIAKAAYDVLWNIANDLSAPGRPKGPRREAARQFMALLAHSPAAPAGGGPGGAELEQARVRKALRLLAVVTPEGCAVGPIAALLADANLRDAARTTLQRIGTTEARAALRDALNGADVEYTCALLTSLGELRDRESIPFAAKLAFHNAAQARVAAARALAWTGEPRHADTLRRVVKQATRDTAFDATDALLRYADAVAVNGGNWQFAINLYLEVLRTTPFGLLKGSALVGLGRFGDETVVPAILKAIPGGDPRVQATAITALRSLEGAAPARRMLELYPKQPASVRLAMIEIIGQRHEAAALPLLLETARSKNAAFRRAALRALGDARSVDGLPVLMETARSGGAADKAVALESVAQLADTFNAKGDKAGAGQAYAALYGLAQDNAQRKHALTGITACPNAAAFPVAMEAAAVPELKEPAITALIAVAGALVAAGDHAKALEAYTKVSSLNPSIETMGQIAGAMKQLGSTENFARRLGFITAWRLVGPFDWDAGAGWKKAHVGEPTVNLAATYLSDGKHVGWVRHETTDEIGKVNLRATVADRDYCIAYAFTEVTVAQGADAVLRLGVDDGETVWVNGEAVFENLVNRPLQVDQDQIRVKLRAGVNTILLKISQNNLSWEFCARLTTPDGLLFPFEQSVK